LKPIAVERRRGDLTEYGFNPTVTARTPPFIGVSYIAAGPSEKELRKNGETARLSLLDNH
jgi:hypothetical protein